MANRPATNDRELREQPSGDEAREVKRADPEKFRAAVQKVRRRDAELLKRLAR